MMLADRMSLLDRWEKKQLREKKSKELKTHSLALRGRICIFGTSPDNDAVR